MHERYKVDLGKLENPPQPIGVTLHPDNMIALRKQDVEIMRVDETDYETIRMAVTLLNGMLKAGIVYGEIEQMRDILKDVLGGS